MSEAATLEREARDIRADFIARAKEIRERSRPSNVLEAARERAAHAAMPLLAPIEKGIKNSGAAWIVGAAIGLATLSRNTSKPSPSRGLTSDLTLDGLRPAPPLAHGKTMALLGVGAAAGILLGGNIPVTETERRLFRAVQQDLKNGFVRASNRGFESLLQDESVRANALKIGLAALAVLMRPQRSEQPGAERPG